MTKTDTKIQNEPFDWMPENVKDLFNFLPVLGGLVLMAAVGMGTTVVLMIIDFLVQ